jgi:hypothetical protein
MSSFTDLRLEVKLSSNRDLGKLGPELGLRLIPHVFLCALCNKPLRTFLLLPSTADLRKSDSAAHPLDNEKTDHAIIHTTRQKTRAGGRQLHKTKAKLEALLE